jgi:hypothetical protein
MTVLDNAANAGCKALSRIASGATDNLKVYLGLAYLDTEYTTSRRPVVDPELPFPVIPSPRGRDGQRTRAGAELQRLA